MAVMPLIHGGTSDVRCLHPAKDSPGAAGSFLDIEGERTMLTRRKHPRRNVGSPIHSCIPLKSILVLERMTVVSLTERTCTGLDRGDRIGGTSCE